MTPSRTRARIAAGACLGIAGLIVGLVVVVLWLRGDLEGPRGADSRDLPEASHPKKEGDSLAVAPGDPATAGTIESLWVVTGRVVEVRADDVPPDLVSLPWKPEKRPPPRPAAGVRLRLVRSDAPTASPSVAASPSVTVTREDGGFEFAGVPSGVPLEISVDEPGRCAATMTLVLGKPERPTLWPVEWKGIGFAPRIDVGTIESGSCESLTVEVTDLWGAPVTGALVRAGFELEVSHGFGVGELAHRAEVVAPGVYLIRGLNPGRHEVHVEAEGWGASWEEVAIPRAEPLLISLEQGTEIRGRVVDTSGNPIEGAEIRVRHLCEMARSDFEGRFTLRHLDVYWTMLEVQAPGYVSLETQVAVASDDIELRLLREARISGTVVRAIDGAPVPGAEVLLECANDDDVGTSGYTGPLGTFDLRGLPPGAYRLGADHDDHPRSETQDLDLREGDSIADLRIEFPSGLNRVVVVRDAVSGAPVSGATVDNARVERRTGDDGTCTIVGLQVGSTPFSVRACGYLPILDAEVTLGEEPKPIEFRLEVGGTIFGRVVGPDGAPIAGACIDLMLLRTPDVARSEAQDRLNAYADKCFRAGCVTGFPPSPTGPDGRFRIDGLPTSSLYSIEATHPGFGPAIVTRIAPGPKGDPVELELRLLRGGTIEVQIVSDLAGPIVGAEVRWYVLKPPVKSPFYQWERPLGWPWGWRHSLAATDESGMARLENLLPGKYALHVSADGCLPTELGGVPVEDGGSVPLRLELRSGHFVSGRVLTWAGEPVAGAVVRDSQDWERSTRAGPDGRFRLGGVGSGIVRLEADRWGFAVASTVVHVPGDTVEFRMLALGRVSGRVVAPGRAWLLPGQDVGIKNLDPAEWDSGGIGSTQIDRTGGFDVMLGPGRYRLTFPSNLPGLASMSRDVDLQSGEHIRLVVEFPPAGNVSVLVVSAETREPLEDASLRSESPEGTPMPLGDPTTFGDEAGSAETFEDEDTRGRYAFSIPAGAFALRVSHGHYRPQRIAGLSVEPGQSLEVVVALEGGTGIYGLVTRRGSRVVGARVTCGPKGGPATGEAWTDVGGRYEVPVSEDGDCEVRVEAPDGKMATAATYVEAGRWTDLPLDLTPVRLHGRVLADGQPIWVDVLYCMPESGGRVFDASVDEDGRYEMSLPSPGRYVLQTIDDEGTHSAKLEIDVPLDVSDYERDIELP